MIGIALLVLCGVGGFISPSQFFHSYLMGLQLWLGVAVGCLAWVMVHQLSGGGWGNAIRPLLHAATRTIPVLAVLWVPLLFGLQTLYLWTRADVVANDPILQQKQPFLNLPFFLLRAILPSWCGSRSPSS